MSNICINRITVKKKSPLLLKPRKPINREPSEFDDLNDFRTGFLTKRGKWILAQKYFTMEGKSGSQRSEYEKENHTKLAFPYIEDLQDSL